MRAVLLVSILACFALGQEEEERASELLAADRAFCEATLADGLEGWLRWFAPDAVIPIPTGEYRTGPDELRDYYTSTTGFPPAGFQWKPQSADLAQSGELGYTLGSWSLRAPGSAPGDEPQVTGTYLTVWKRQPDGSYKVVTDVGGRTDFRTRLEGVDAPPLEWSSTTHRSETAKSGEIAFVLGSWSAQRHESERVGKFLTIWRRPEDNVWEIAAEIGFDH